MKKILIIGSSGFIGRNTARFFTQAGYEVAELNCIQKSADFQNIELIYNHLKENTPDIILNCAGSFTNNFMTDFNANFVLPRNLLESVLKTTCKIKVILLGSASEYGLITEKENPVTENRRLNPISIYGFTKKLQTELMRFYCEKYDMDINIARLFNVYGKELSKQLFIGNLYAQIRDYKTKKNDKIILGNLNTKRDYYDIQNICNDLQIICECGKSGEVYNVAAGYSTLLKDIVNKVFLEEQIPPDVLETDMNKQQSNGYDLSDIYADTTKINELKELYAGDNKIH